MTINDQATDLSALDDLATLEATIQARAAELAILRERADLLRYQASHPAGGPVSLANLAAVEAIQVLLLEMDNRPARTVELARLAVERGYRGNRHTSAGPLAAARGCFTSALSRCPLFERDGRRGHRLIAQPDPQACERYGLYPSGAHGRELRRRREALGISLMVMAQRAGLAAEVLDAVESGRVFLQYRTSVRIDLALRAEEGESV